MKKLLLSLGLITTCFFSANAQEISENAIGLRFTENGGFGTEISYQRGLGDNNRLEVDLGLRSSNTYSSYRLTGLYQWLWQLDGNFNWYAGAGGGIGSWNIKNSDASDTYLFGAGVIGVEYNFDIPIIVSLDFRPEFGFSDAYDGFNSDFGLSVRYQF